ncbi:MAG: hypothetical protein JSS87_00210 [Acidobacteria bacterium]|nr:hypothetical protein [Acidobacteriota bacterium]
MPVRESKPLHMLAVGEVLWDIFGDNEHLGGAALNFCANIARLGGDAVLVSAVGDDERGRNVLRAMDALGLSSQCVDVTAKAATGTAVVSALSHGESGFVIPRPAAFDHAGVDLLSALDRLPQQVDWIYFGTLLQCTPAAEDLVSTLLQRYSHAHAFYDLNLRDGHWNFDLVQRLSRRAHMMKLNLGEAQALSQLSGTPSDDFHLETFCRQWSATYSIDTLCITLGDEGCLIHTGGASEYFPGFPIRVHDTVGAGDAFAAAFLYGYSAGWPMADVARLANAAGAIVASRPGATPSWNYEDCTHLIEQGTRA